MLDILRDSAPIDLPFGRKPLTSITRFLRPVAQSSQGFFPRLLARVLTHGRNSDPESFCVCFLVMTDSCPGRKGN